MRAMTCEMKRSDDSVYFRPANKVYFFKQTCPTKKPDQDAPGHPEGTPGFSFRVIKTISQNVCPALRADESVPQILF